MQFWGRSCNKGQVRVGVIRVTLFERRVPVVVDLVPLITKSNKGPLKVPLGIRSFCTHSFLGSPEQSASTNDLGRGGVTSVTEWVCVCGYYMCVRGRSYDFVRYIHTGQHLRLGIASVEYVMSTSGWLPFVRTFAPHVDTQRRTPTRRLLTTALTCERRGGDSLFI